MKKLFFWDGFESQREQIVELILLPPEEEKQIVDKAAANEIEPVESKYLSEKNNSVKDETKSKTEFQAEINEEKPSPRKSEHEAEEEERAKVKAEIEIPEEKLPDIEKLKVDLENNSEIARHLTPPESSDYLPGILEKDKTALNTREFVYYSFYERVKKRVGMFWTPALEEKFRKMYYANIDVDNRDLITKLIIVLDDHGQIRKIEKIASSGFKNLDDAAIEAFNKAAPFSNPPKGILDDDNTVILRWDFILKSRADISIGEVLSKL